jgi:heat shock protein HslJ
MSWSIDIGAGSLLAAVVLCGVGAAAAQPAATPAKPLVGTYWKAVELAGKPVPAPSAPREAHLEFQANGRVSGADGCNSVTGGYALNGDSLTFGQLAGTRMACIGTGETERAFHDALQATSAWNITGDRLELMNAAGAKLAVFQARTPTAASPLEGTSWPLVRVEGGDGTVREPDDPARYGLGALRPVIR